MGQKWAVSLAARIAVFAAWLFVSACASDAALSSMGAGDPDASVASGEEGKEGALATPQAKTLGSEVSLETAVWEQRTSPPGGRHGVAAAFDEDRKRTVLFGGKRADVPTGDTWEWDGALWTLRSQIGPSARVFAKAAYDAVRKRVVLFGGETTSGAPLGDTWEWDGAAWKSACTGSCAATSPPARSRHSAVWDPVMKAIVVFGGKGQSGPRNDIWAWTGEKWIELPTVGPKPSARERASLAWDPNLKQALLFGGSDATGHLADTWSWDGSTWALRATTGPDARAAASMFFDGASEKLTIFGGANTDTSPSTVFDDTWVWEDSSRTWHPSTIPIRPVARSEALTVVDSARGKTVLFGGMAFTGTVGDTWEWDGYAWRKIEAYPDARKGFRLAYDPGAGKTLLFGGQLGWGAVNDLWAYGGTRWSRLCTTPACAATAPPGRSDHAMAFDDVRGRLIVYGGGAAGSMVNDLWEFTGTAWEKKCTSAPCTMPSSRWSLSSGAFDSDRQRFVVFGGWLMTSLADTWEWNGSTWAEKCTGSPCRENKPSSRSRSAMTYDPIAKKTMLFGGVSDDGLPLNDLWVWDGNVWRQLCQTAECKATAPSLASLDATLAFDSVRSRAVLFTFQDTWEWDGTRWTKMPGAGPGARDGAHMVFDPDRQRVVLWGGGGLDDTWEYHSRGGPCSVSNDCSTGFCVDGVCCETISCGTCQACDLPSNPGVCSSVVDGDDPDSCFGANTCDSLGRCRQVNGGSCWEDSQCASGFCADGVCCDKACSGGCDVCNAIPGTCTVRVKGSVGESPSCGAYLCDGVSGACPGTCQRDVDCGAGYFCATGGLCQPRRPGGWACSVTAGGNCQEAGCRECQDGLTCKDGFCCSSACSGTCETCAATPGTCTPLRGGDDADTCAGANTCDTAGQCKRKDGQTCSAASQCASGHCVDGVCCNSACTGGCDVCNVTAGVCTVVAQGASGANPSCGAFVCNGSSPSCPTSCGNDADCAAGYYCAADGICREQKGQGTMCNANSGADCKSAGCRVCESGNCVDGFCCDSACGGSCDSCNGAELGWEGATNGTCHFAPTGYAGSPACVTYACDGSSALCATSCDSDVECADGFYCSTNGSCLPQKLQGQACNLTTDCKTGDCRQCVTGNCVDGVCCNSPCTGPCETCSATPGICTPRSAGSLGEPSCAPFFCNGISASCDDSCETDAQCAPEHHCLEGTCHPKKEIGESCANDRQCGTVAFCEDLTSTCVEKSALGEGCTIGRACLSGFCVDGVCCDQACGGQCEACDVGTAKGKCSPVVGAPHGDRPACAAGSGDSGDALCETRSCDGSKSTASCVGYVGAEIGCRDRSCEAGEETFSATCNGQGQCGPSGATKTRSCEPYACGESSCRASCEGEDDCAAGYTCDRASGKCIAGATCDGDHIVTAPGQLPTDCSPYKCEAGGTCRASCASIEDCVSGFVCDLDNHCVPAAFDEVIATSSGCGCRVSGSAYDSSGRWFALALVALTGARLGKRRRA